VFFFQRQGKELNKLKYLFTDRILELVMSAIFDAEKKVL
jgi:hypothetical protein